MKNKFKISLIFTTFFFLFSTAYSLELNIQAQNITVDKNKNLTSLSGSVKASDDKNNILTSDKAIYKKENGVFQSLGETSVTTSEGYELIGKNIYFDNKKKIIWSNEKSILNFTSKEKWDLVIVKGVLIHINPKMLEKVYEILNKDVNSSSL